MTRLPPTPHSAPRSSATRYAVRLLLLGALTACSAPALPAAPAAPGTSSAPASSSPAAGTSTSAGRTVTVTVTGKVVSPPPARVDLLVGETLTLVVTIDHDDTVHAHGFGVEQAVKAGQPVTLTLTGKDPGVFEVETHQPALTLLSIAVR